MNADIVLILAALLVAAAAAVDIYKREIPDSIPAAILILALASTGFHWTRIGWVSLLAGLSLTFLIGLALFKLGGFGGGDVKLLAAIGALLGPRASFSLLFYTALAGGVLALVAKYRKQKDIPYAPAIALGMGVFLIVRFLR
jgi:prepilin peptidase CpaA